MVLLWANAALGQTPPTFVLAWGSQGSGDGQFGRAEFEMGPTGIAVGPNGKIYVADVFNHRIQRFSSDGTFELAWGREGTGDGEFWLPQYVAVDAQGDVYVTDYRWVGYAIPLIQKFTADGTFLLKWGGYGHGPGMFIHLTGITVGPDGYIYVLDSDRMSPVQKFTTSGEFVATWGSQGTGDGQFDYPRAIAVGPDNSVYIADITLVRVQKFTSTGEFLLKWDSVGGDPGQLRWPMALAVSGCGHVYVGDGLRYDMQEFTAGGEFVVSWGSVDPLGAAVDAAQYIYVIDGALTRIVKYAPSTVPARTTTWGRLKNLYR